MLHGIQGLGVFLQAVGNAPDHRKLRSSQLAA
jgi:hypothetical protein